jgi:hypothetical protein
VLQPGQQQQQQFGGAPSAPAVDAYPTIAKR